MQKYPILPPCNDIVAIRDEVTGKMKLQGCKKMCNTRISEEDRLLVHSTFWRKSFNERRQYVDGYVNESCVERRRIDNKGDNDKASDGKSSHPRNVTLCYNLPTSNGTKVNVCKTMFLHTHGMRTDGMITEYLKTKKTNGRGKKSSKDLGVEELTRQHINSYNPQVSHYTLAHAPHRRYLPPDITIQAMYDDFVEKHGKKMSYEKYRQVFTSENIGFARPNQDECGICEAIKLHQQEFRESENNSHDVDNCSSCQKYKIHKEKYDAARIAYKEDSENENWGSDTKVYAVDMQKILIIPKMTIKNSCFVSRLVVFNETFSSLNTDDNNCVLWHEAISVRNSRDVASAYTKFVTDMEAPESKNIIFWTDNCNAQNKNWLLFTSCIHMVNAPGGPSSITFKYLEVGHTYMKADSIHGQIGNQWKRKEKVLTYDDLKVLILKSNQYMTVTSMEANDFIQFEDLCMKRSKKNQIPLLQSIKLVQFRNGSLNMFYKESFTAECFQEIPILKRKVNLDEMKVFPPR